MGSRKGVGYIYIYIFLVFLLAPKLGCQQAVIRTSAVVVWLLFALFLTNLRRIQSGILE